MFQTLLTKKIQSGIEITLNRVAAKNALNALLLSELHQLLNNVEKEQDCNILVFRGQGGFFCTGMDFKEVSGLSKISDHFAENYMRLLKRISSFSAIIISVIEGKTMAGGIGLVAASDLVIATPDSQFSLPEVLWGLLPANVLPWLIRRTGFQPAFRLTLTAQTLSAAEAQKIHLVDEVSATPENILNRYLRSVSRLHSVTIRHLKEYMQSMWIIDESMEKTATHKLTSLMRAGTVTENICRFVQRGLLPWEKENA